mmetsp:Transcript_82709/g.192172  ORF Transcript_82709/g.192172 Transcript_82709/m.192172 type:complete len:206 (-) Transcript_82709:23-640(-)
MTRMPYQWPRLASPHPPRDRYRGAQLRQAAGVPHYPTALHGPAVERGGAATSRCCPAPCMGHAQPQRPASLRCLRSGHCELPLLSGATTQVSPPPAANRGTTRAPVASVTPAKHVLHGFNLKHAWILSLLRRFRFSSTFRNPKEGACTSIVFAAPPVGLHVVIGACTLWIMALAAAVAQCHECCQRQPPATCRWRVLAASWEVRA